MWLNVSRMKGIIFKKKDFQNLQVELSRKRNYIRTSFNPFFT